MKHIFSQFRIIAFTALSLAASSFFVPRAGAADEVCVSCGPQVSVSGSFAHHKDRPSVVIEGTPDNASAFREDVNGTNFVVTISGLPAGKYNVIISAAETASAGAGERVFDVLAGDQTLAKDFDSLAAAGGARKVANITGSVDHADDAIRGPLRITFVADKGNAKFNTVDIKNAEGASVVSFKASELADAFSASASRVPDIKEPMIWRDPSHSVKDRANDLIRRMSLAEKVAQLKNAAPGIGRLGLPTKKKKNKTLHGVANNGAATVFPGPGG